MNASKFFALPFAILLTPALASASPPRQLLPGPDSPIGLGSPRACVKYWDHGAPNRCEGTKRCVSEGQAQLRRKLEAPNLPAVEKAGLLAELGQVLAYDGKTLEESAAAFEEASSLPGLSADLKWRLIAQQGLAYLRLGEQVNCVKNHNRDSCLFPLRAAARHKLKTGSQRAAEAFQRALELKEHPHLIWLFNLAHMTLGTYPKAVPERWRVPEARLTAGKPFPRFYDVAMEAGIATGMNFAGGNVMLDDLNGDGLTDAVVGQRLHCTQTSYFQHNGKSFDDKSAASGLMAQIGVTNVVQADYNNDGKLDLYLTRGAWDIEGDKPFVRNSLMEGDGKGGFKEVTESAGLSGPDSNIAAVWADFDRDGWVDLFVCNEVHPPHLWKNEAGKFRDVYAAAGIEYEGRCKGVATGDVNNDGNLDLLLALYGKGNLLFHGDGEGKFRKVSAPELEKKPWLPFPVFFFDYDNDGWLDLFIGSFERDMTHFSSWLLGRKDEGETSRLFRNQGGAFRNVTLEAGLRLPAPVMAANYGDLNGDGYPELILATGSNTYADLVPNFVFLNEGGKTFADVSRASGMSSLQKGHGVGVADLENKGKLDVVQVLGGALPGDTYMPGLYRNPGFGNRHLTLRLQGVKSNRAAIGARVAVRFVEGKKERVVHRVVGLPSSFGGSPLRLTIGLGKASALREVEVRWPDKARTTQKFAGLKLDSSYLLVEGEAGAKPAPLPAAKLPASKAGQHSHH